MRLARIYFFCKRKSRTYWSSKLLIFARHYSLQECVAFFADVGDARAWVFVGEGRRDDERVDLERDAFFVEFVFDDRGDELLLEARNVGELDADASVVEAIDRFARERKEIFVGQLDLETKFVADVDILFPSRKTAADTNLLELRRLPLAVLELDHRRYIKRESDVLSLIYRHRSQFNSKQGVL